MQKLTVYMKTKLLKSGIAVAVGAIIVIIIMSAKEIYTETDIIQVMSILCDSFFVAGVVLTCAGLLIFVSNGGVFDIFAYGFHMFINLFRRDVTKRKYRTYYDYKEAKKEARKEKKGMGFLLIVGIIFIVISVCFLIPYYALQQPGM